MVDDTAARRAAFDEAYARISERWPPPTETATLESDFGTTRVQISGPAEAPPLVLLPAYQASSAEWIALAGALNGRMRVYAVDLVGDAGGSTVGARSITTPDDMVAWLDTVLDGLALPITQLGGHSYGAWIAAEYAQRRPGRVSRLVLVDPTMVFASLVPPYVLRAMPFILQPTPGKRRWLIRWETRKVPLDQDWVELTAAAPDLFSTAPTVPTKIPSKAALAELRVPTLVLIAGKSRVHPPRKVGAKAARRLPDAHVQLVAGASHYGIPMTHAAELAALITASP